MAICRRLEAKFQSRSSEANQGSVSYVSQFYRMTQILLFNISSAFLNQSTSIVFYFTVDIWALSYRR